MKDKISIYARIKPTDHPAGCHSAEASKITFHKLQDERFMTTNARSVFDFSFDGIFDMDAKQEDVFDTIARPVIDAYELGDIVSHIA